MKYYDAKLQVHWNCLSTKIFFSFIPSTRSIAPTRSVRVSGSIQNVNRLFLKWMTDIVCMYYIWGSVGLTKYREHCTAWFIAKFVGFTWLRSLVGQNKSNCWPCHAHCSDTHCSWPKVDLLSHLGVDKILPPSYRASTTNFATLTLPPSAISKYVKLPLSQCEVRINSALLLSQLHIWVEIMASREVVEELVAGEVPT